jgi:hypothetical protein
MATQARLAVVSDQKVERLLEVVKAKLGASDARIEIGGKAPTSADTAWHALPHGRVVAVFDVEIPDPEMMQKRLASLCGGFQEIVHEAIDRMPLVRTEDPREQLDEELGALAERAGASRAVVLDLASDVVWGVSRVSPSHTQTQEMLEQWVLDVRSNYSADLRSSRGHVIRLAVCEDKECLAKLFGGAYVVSLFFDAPLSEPVAVGALLHAAGRIERLVVALPPIEPPPGGKVLRLGPRMRPLW